MRRLSLSDVLIIAGLLLLGAGLAAYDWRVASIVLGALLLLAGGYGMVRGA